MNILLVNPPFATEWPLSLGFGEPLGLAYVAAAVEASGRHGVAILDAVGSASTFHLNTNGERNWVGLSHDQVIAAMGERQFDSIGVTVARTSWVDTGIEPLIERMRQTFPGRPIIVGGPEVSHYWERFAENPAVDVVVIGEGEETIVALLDALDGGGDLSTVAGIAHRDAAGKVVRNPDPPPPAIDSLAWPARHLLPMRTYIDNRPTTDLPAATILTSRACPFRCAFCSTIEIWGHNWRGRSAKDVVDEIAFLKQTYGIREIRVQDDNFCVKRSRVVEICDLLISRGLDVRLYIEPGVMAHLATAELLTQLWRAGMRDMCMQLESGSAKTQAYIDKKIDVDHVRAMLDWAHHLGMRVRTNLILGFPHETAEDMRESARVAIDLPYDHIEFYFLEPKRNTRSWRDMVALGIIAADHDERTPLPVPTLHCTAEEVAEIRRWAIAEFEASRKARSRGTTLVLDPGLIRAERGHCYIYHLPQAVDLADDEDHPLRSPLQLSEASSPLGPAHTLHDFIRARGQGGFSHWGNRLYFSTSDNSDPRHNGRLYTLSY